MIPEFEHIKQFVTDIAPFLAIVTSLITIGMFLEQKRLLPKIENILRD